MTDSTLRTAIARAIHDGPNAQAQYEMAGIRPHTAEECEWFDQYLADADAVLKVLADPPFEVVEGCVNRIEVDDMDQRNRETIVITVLRALLETGEDDE